MSCHIFLFSQQRPAPGETHLQAEDDEHRGEGARGGQGGGDQAAQGPGRHQGVRPPGQQGEEPRGGDGPHGAAHRALKATRKFFWVSLRKDTIFYRETKLFSLKAFRICDKTLRNIPEQEQWLCVEAYQWLFCKIATTSTNHHSIVETDNKGSWQIQQSGLCKQTISISFPCIEIETLLSLKNWHSYKIEN